MQITKELTKHEAKELYEALQKITKIPVEYVYPISSVVGRNFMKLRRGVIDEIMRRHATIIKDLSEKDANGQPKLDTAQNIQFGTNIQEADKRYSELMIKLKEEKITINFETVTETYAKECRLSGDLLYPIYDYIIIPDPIEEHLSASV